MKSADNSYDKHPDAGILARGAEPLRRHIETA
jgi:hypothetical protein